MTKSTKWFLGILAVLVLIAGGFILLLFSFFSAPLERTETVTSGTGEKIAVVELTGVINTSEDLIRQFKKYRENRSIKAIVLRIDSPGGGVVASQEMYEEVKRTRDRGKPVIVSMGSLAASGGYYVACGSTKIVANRGTLTGSIGVISEILQVHDALSKLGIDVKTIKTGKLKDAGTSTRNMTKEDRKYFQTLLDDVYRQFLTVVETERKMDHEKAVELADGRVFTGEQALALGLVDTLGTFEDAVRIAARTVGISGEPAIVKERRRQLWWDSLFGSVGESLTSLKQEFLERPILSYRFAGPM